MPGRVSKCVPISKSLLFNLGTVISGRIGTQWVCQRQGKRHVIVPYASYGVKDPSGYLFPWQNKFAAGVAAAKSLSPELREYWQVLGTNRLDLLPWFQTFLSAWMLDLVNLSTMRHVRNLKVFHV